MQRVLLGLAMIVVATLAPAWSMAGEAEDNEVAHRIAANLKTSGQMKNYQIGVTCENGTVWLSGTVANRQQMSKALMIVKQTEGVEQIIDDLTIDSSGGEPSLRPANQLAEMKDVRQTSADEYEQGMQPRMAVPRNVSLERMHPQMRQPMPQANRSNVPLAYAGAGAHPMQGQPIPSYTPGPGTASPARYDNPQMPNYAWPSYAPYPNYGAVTYPKQYSPTAWPFIGPFYPYPQVPLGWRKVTLEWDDGWWMLDFKD